MTASRIRWALAAVFVGGIAGMIVGSIRDDNGLALAFGLGTAAAALCLIAVTTVLNEASGEPVFDDAAAAELEARIEELVEGGADERKVWEVARAAVLLGRSARASR